MGTNYYGRLKKPIKRTYLDYQRFHIGKSSCGWKFAFQKGKHFSNFEEFKKWLDNDNYVIFDEYDRKIDKKEFLEMILEKQKTGDQRENDIYTTNIDGFDFIEDDFS